MREHSKHHKSVITKESVWHARSMPRGTLWPKLDLSNSLSTTRYPTNRARASWFVSKKKVAPRVLPGTVLPRLTLAQQKKARAEHLAWCDAMSRGN